MNALAKKNRSNGRPSQTTFRPRLTHLEDRAVPSFGWAAGVGGNDLATDAAGDVYMVGNFSGGMTPAGSSSPLVSAGGNDIFVAKYARSGAFQWATSLGGSQNDRGSSIAVDAGGNVVVGGIYAGTANFGSIALTSPA